MECKYVKDNINRLMFLNNKNFMHANKMTDAVYDVICRDDEIKYSSKITFRIVKNSKIFYLALSENYTITSLSEDEENDEFPFITSSHSNKVTTQLSMGCNSKIIKYLLKDIDYDVSKHELSFSDLIRRNYVSG